MKQFKRSTRSADIGGARFWRIDPSADYGLLNGVARHRTTLAREEALEMPRLLTMADIPPRLPNR